MKIRAELIFSVVLGALLTVLPSVPAATANVSTNLVPAGGDTNVNLNATMTALFGDPVIAQGKGVEIKQSDLDGVMTGYQTAAAARGQVIPPEQLKIIKLGMLDRLIDLQLLLQQATEADQAAGKQDFEKSLQELKASQKLTDAEFDQKLDLQLKLQGMTREKWDKQNIDQATAIAVLKHKLVVKATDADAKKFYDAHPADFEQPEMVHIAQIYLSTHNPATAAGAELSDTEKAAKEKEMEDILKQARAGESFKKLVEKYSEDPDAKDTGGEYTFARGQTPPEFEAAAFSLNTNQISDVVTTTSGYHIIKLLEKIPAKTESFAGLDTKIAGNPNLTLGDILTAQAIQAGAPKYLMGLRKSADVEILDPDFKELQHEADASVATNAAPFMK
ncbi:MAG: peptidylprolyl isomerase [Verrucomicrobiia bacterium]